MTDPQDRANPLEHPPLFARSDADQSDEEQDDPLAWQRRLERFQALDREALWNAAPAWWEYSLEGDQVRQFVAVLVLVLIGVALGGALGVVAGAHACAGVGL